jgi:protoporphyrinogen oxidase
MNLNVLKIHNPFTSPKAVVLGAGPAGLACAWELSRHKISTTVVDQNPQAGGLLRAIALDGYHFDIGGHRFLSKSEEVNQLWKEILGPELLHVKRRSRILYRGKYFEYPLQVRNALGNLGPLETLRCIASYLSSKFFPQQAEGHFETWMVRRFGRRLYELFFRTYTEKVWGIPCSALSGDWADQRIQDFSLGKALRDAIKITGRSGCKTLSDDFVYPVLGPGLFCEKLQQQIESNKGHFDFQTSVEKVYHQGGKILHLETRCPDGKTETLRGDHFFASIPLRHLIEKLQPSAPEAVLKAAHELTFRSFMVVFLILDIKNLFPDQWLYIHDPEIKAGRIQNYKNWSAAMVPNNSTTSLGMEYFINQGDATWNLTDKQMTDLAVEELVRLGFDVRSKLLKSLVVRVPDAYPIYSSSYRENLAVLQGFLASITNLQVMGRAGLFRYNNSDHALLTGLYAARNLLGEKHDLWTLDPDAP